MSRSDDLRAVLNGHMSHEEFDAKWPPVTPAQTKAYNQLVDKRNARIHRWEAARRRANAQRRALQSA